MAWGWGGYARIFPNVQGRELQGTIPPEDYTRARTKLAERLRAIRDPAGCLMDDPGVHARRAVPVVSRRSVRLDGLLQ